VRTVADATLLMAPRIPLTLFNRAIGLGMTEPASADDLDTAPPSSAASDLRIVAVDRSLVGETDRALTRAHGAPLPGMFAPLFWRPRWHLYAANWTPPLAALCLYYPGRRNASAALKAFIGLARKLSAKSRS
jgi:hypothetical protein